MTENPSQPSTAREKGRESDRGELIIFSLLLSPNRHLGTSPKCLLNWTTILRSHSAAGATMAGLKGREGEPSPFHLLSLPYSTMSFGLQGSKAFILLTSAFASLGGAQGSWRSKDESLTGRKRRGKESGWVGLMPHLSENERGEHDPPPCASDSAFFMPTGEIRRVFIFPSDLFM